MKKNIHELTYQIRHNMISGVLCGWKKVIPFVFIVISFCVYLSISCSELKEIDYISNTPTTSDYLLYIFRGMREYNPKVEIKFEIPITWLMIQLYIAFVIGNYATKDMVGYGQQFLLRTTKKTYWYIGKCFYCIANVISYYLLAYIVILIYSFFFGNFSFTLSADIGGAMSEIDTSLFTDISFVLNIIVLPILTSIVIALVQMLLSLFIRPTLSYAAIIVYQTLSAYFVSYLLLGNYSMALRCKPFLQDGINTFNAVFIDVILIITIISAGSILIQKYDYLERT